MNLQRGDHAFFLYRSDAEHRQVLSAFLKDGLRLHEKILYLIDEQSPTIVMDYLKDEPELGRCLAACQLEVLDSHTTYLRGGTFEPERMMGYFAEQMQKALEQNYAGLRVTGEATWALEGLPGTEHLGAYESNVNPYFSGNAFVGLCQYNARRFSAKMLLELLLAHPVIVVGGRRVDNRHYLTPAEFLVPEIRAQHLQRWYKTSAENSVDAFLKDLAVA